MDPEADLGMSMSRLGLRTNTNCWSSCVIRLDPPSIQVATGQDQPCVSWAWHPKVAAHPILVRLLLAL